MIFKKINNFPLQSYETDWPQVKLFLSAMTGFSLAFCFENSYSTFKANFIFIFYKENFRLAKLLQSCPTPCNRVECSTPSSFVHGDSPGKNTEVRLPCPPPGDLSNLGIEPRSPALQANSLPSEPLGKPILQV